VTKLSVLFLVLILTACAISTTEFPTQVAILPTQTLFPPSVEPLPIGDGGLISDQPCPSPCFFDVRIGETLLNQVVPILENNRISPCYQFNERIIACGDGVSAIIVGANISTSVVEGITYYPSVSISIEEIIEKHGRPNLVQVELVGTPEAPAMSLFLLWDSIKMRIDLPEGGNIGEQNYVVERTTKVKAITFMDDASYAELSANGFVQPWKGYGTYKP